MTHLFTFVLPTLLLCNLLPAQTSELAYVATQLKGSPSTQILDVDLVSGKFTALGRFKHDAIPPLAISVDPNTRDIILAVNLGSSSRLLRLVVRSGKIQTETILTDIKGQVHSMILSHKGAIYATVIGVGLYKIERTGSAKRLFLSLPRITGISTMPVFSTSIAVLIEKGSVQPKIAPRLSIIELEAGKIVQGPFSYPNITNPNIMSVGALKTAVDRFFLADDKGQIYFSYDIKKTALVSVSPQMPAGGTRRVLHSRLCDGIVLGGAADPRIKQIRAGNTSQNWRFITARLPGDPVDIVIRPSKISEERLYGDGCTPGRGTPLALRFNNPPFLGNRNFGFTLKGALGNSPVAMLLGTNSQNFLNTRLPITLPGGCDLLTSVNAVLAILSNGAGAGLILLPVPNNKALIGQILCGQWVELRAGGFATSNGGSAQLFPSG